MEMSLERSICDAARELGFDPVGIAPAHPVPTLDAYRSWLARGHHGQMGYLARPDRVERREDLTAILPGARSILCVGLNYCPGALPDGLRADPSRGLISNYAWGVDYHLLMLDRLEELAEVIRRRVGGSVAHRAYVDTGPLLERAHGAEAGLGFVGKNTCLIHPRMGSWFFLGEILLDVPLAPTTEPVRGGCGTCRRCLDACPTGALVAPYVVDARLCISYLTIELKGAIPPHLRPLLGNHIYGCDVCQAVCPWQRFAPVTAEQAFLAPEVDRAAPALLDLIGMDEAAFRLRFEGTPIERIKRRGLLRNVAVALGNWGSARAIPALTGALHDPEPLVRQHAAWALERCHAEV